MDITYNLRNRTRGQVQPPFEELPNTGLLDIKSCGESSPAIVTRANETFSLSMLGFIARVMRNPDVEHARSVGICGWCAPGTEVGRNGEVTCGVSSPVIVTRANEAFSLSMLGFIARV